MVKRVQYIIVLTLRGLLGKILFYRLIFVMHVRIDNADLFIVFIPEIEQFLFELVL